MGLKTSSTDCERWATQEDAIRPVRPYESGLFDILMSAVQHSFASTTTN